MVFRGFNNSCVFYAQTIELRKFLLINFANIVGLNKFSLDFWFKLIVFIKFTLSETSLVK